MADRMFNDPCSAEERDADWAKLSPSIREMLKPFRDDSTGVPAALFSVASDYSDRIDIMLIQHASGGDAGKALQFVLAEVIATVEGCLDAAKKAA